MTLIVVIFNTYPFFPSNVMTWSFSLLTFFPWFFYWPTGCYSKRRVYTPKSFSSHYQITSRYFFSILIHKTLVDDSRRLNKLLSSHLHPRSHSNLNHVHSHFSNSQAETTITQHFNTSPSLGLSKPLVIKGDSKSYTRNPTNGNVSKLLDGFFGCLGCVSYSHLLRIQKSAWQSSSHCILADTLCLRSQDNEKKLSPPFIPEVSVNYVTFVSPPSFTSNMLFTPSSTAIKHGMGRGSHINRPA